MRPGEHLKAGEAAAVASRGSTRATQAKAVVPQGGHPGPFTRGLLQQGSTGRVIVGPTRTPADTGDSQAETLRVMHVCWGGVGGACERASVTSDEPQMK